MKKLILTLATLFLTFTAFAQAPNKMSYQAVVRNANNELVANSKVGMQISILQASPTGNTVYAETQNPVSNENGLISLQIGTGTVIFGDMNEIDWSQGPYFLQTETDPSGGTNYSILTTSELMSVPFAMQSTHADSAKHAGTTDLAAKAITATNADMATKAGSAGSAIYAEFTDSANIAAFAYDAGKANQATNATNANRAAVSDSAKTSDFAWETPSRKRSIVFNPGSVKNLGGATFGTNGWFPVIDLAEGGIREFNVGFPVPSDFKGNNFTVRVMYTSTTATGNFDCSFFVRGLPVGASLNTGPGGGGLQLPSPSAPNILAEGSTVLNTNGAGANADYLLLHFRRRSGSAADTSTGTLRILGFQLEYND